MKLKNLTVLILLVFSLIGCSSKFVSGSLIHDEQTGPKGPVAGERAIEIAYTAKEFEHLWSDFNFNENQPDIDFDESAILIAHTMENSCPMNIERFELSEDGTKLTIETAPDGDGDGCDDIGFLKSFVFTIEKSKLEKVKTVYFEGEPFDM
ncbi:hypothetical protein JOC95_001517 [Bacillus tianshenii]|uniref:Lipoprotein n=1 Tax=Sutcliffiella tianshenii TaxID=1463404 RepID=A0ABS2NYE8_9BACI|nr:hypothetical protein [Bacillus tianshenii]MBM7619665.1 hypothetical protein [Bacillus tianshenii]